MHDIHAPYPTETLLHRSPYQSARIRSDEDVKLDTPYRRCRFPKRIDQQSGSPHTASRAAVHGGIRVVRAVRQLDDPIGRRVHHGVEASVV
jgi:hypothetical protein